MKCADWFLPHEPAPPKGLIAAVGVFSYLENNLDNIEFFIPRHSEILAMAVIEEDDSGMAMTTLDGRVLSLPCIVSIDIKLMRSSALQPD